MSNMNKKSQMKATGFTIVELLVVIVVIGILASITIISYSGITKKAVTSTLQSDLSNASKQLKMYQVNNGKFPTSIDAGNCPIPADALIGCLRSSSGNAFTYSAPNSTSAFILTAANGTTKYRINNNSAPILDIYASNASWIAGTVGTALAGKYVRSTDLGGAYQFKTTNSAEGAPQSSIGLDPSYISSMSLVSPQDNSSVDFSAYPAQSACQAINGRIPNMQELAAIYTGRATTYGNNFQTLFSPYYWSGTEGQVVNPSLARMNAIEFTGGSMRSDDDKMATSYVRCVAG